jgi:ABC-type transporter Mla maintaining outer membrane lipid asymmetry permease subunit MlaE
MKYSSLCRVFCRLIMVPLLVGIGDAIGISAVQVVGVNSLV